MNNNNEINTMVADYNGNNQYFKDIVESKCINRTIDKALAKYKRAVDKIMSMVNVTKIIDLDIPTSQNANYTSNYHVVLSNNGLRSRYVSSNYITQSTELNYTDFSGIFNRALKVIFAHPNISTMQKNKILPLKGLDVSFLANILTNEKLTIESVTRIGTDLSVVSGNVVIPYYTGIGTYGNMTNFTLLSIRTQITQELNNYLVERRAILEEISTKRKELETMFPILFMFGDK